MKYKCSLIASINSAEFQFIMPLLGQGKAYGVHIAPEFWLL